jgi:exodeoxyribonuclease III
LEFNDFFFVTVYTPNSKDDLSRLVYRKTWDNIFLKYLKHLEKEKPVVFC